MKAVLAYFKGYARHAMYRSGVLDAYLAIRVGRNNLVERRPGQSLSDIFSQIYERGVWRESTDQESLSGAGSTKAATASVVDQLNEFLAAIDCRRLVDIGCGDFNWMQSVKGDFEYIGIDVVPAVVDSNNKQYKSDKRIFICLDATKDYLEGGDVAICREVLFHLPLADGKRLLSNIKAAGFRYIVLTDEPHARYNADIAAGDCRPINLQKAPFGLPCPERVLVDDQLTKGQILGIWRCALLPDYRADHIASGPVSSEQSGRPLI